MNILVWGYGGYYIRKKENLKEDTIVAFVSSDGQGDVDGIPVISPSDITGMEYDKLYIMAGAIFEIVETLQTIGYTAWDKLELGYNLQPYIDSEFILCESGRLECDMSGIIVYVENGESYKITDCKVLDMLKCEKVRHRYQNKLKQFSELEPVSKEFGFDRGMPIDRYYIEQFLNENSRYIQGTVLEVAERTYTLKFGDEAVVESYTMHVCDEGDEKSFICNLETGEGVGKVENSVDCFILTQPLTFIYDLQTTVKNIMRILKPGGVALVTVGGITQISRYDMDRWGHYWNFTTASMKRLFQSCPDVADIEVRTYGNMKTSIAQLYGLSMEELSKSELDYTDEDYQQIITAIVRKV